MADNNNQQSNFSFLTEHWAFLLDDTQQVEGYTHRTLEAPSSGCSPTTPP